ncbi:MAG TPA: SRPBCC family protein [Streptosporangiaceae bacterium]|nr:SRPBCC family protein [Streptosporangiaceae bacterium]
MSLVPASLTISAGATVAADPRAVWDLAVDWAAQRRWIWATTTSGGHGLGAAVTGRTGIGRAGFTDTMVITEWDPPRRCTVSHTGRVVRGEGVFEVLPRENGAEFRWTERIVLPEALVALVPAALRPAFTRLAYAAVAPVARAGLGYSLIRFARLLAGPRA